MSTSTLPTYQNLRLERRDAVTVLYVNRPQVMNAINRETLGEIADAAATEALARYLASVAGADTAGGSFTSAMATARSAVLETLVPSETVNDSVRAAPGALDAHANVTARSAARYSATLAAPERSSAPAAASHDAAMAPPPANASTSCPAR